MTTGTLPTFAEFGSNFAGTAIEEDNLLAQLRAAGKKLVHLGDDTWNSLFPGYFDSNLTHAYDSFNVWDLHTVDNGVTEHLLPLLESPTSGKWDVIFGHYLGVDHAGHRYGPDHLAMAAKLSQMNEVLQKVIAVIDDKTLLVVMGDHGMDTKGDHGGESDDEVEAVLWMYSKMGIFGRLSNDSVLPPQTAKERPVAQIDLVPTLSLLLGLPIPFNNLGSPIAEAFAGNSEPDWKTLAAVNALSAAQINNYQREYARARGLDEAAFVASSVLRDNAFGLWAKFKESSHTQAAMSAFNALRDYQQETLRGYKSLWARFDVPSMIEGIVILGFAPGILGYFARSTTRNEPVLIPNYLRGIGTFGTVGAIFGLAVKLLYPAVNAIDIVLLSTSGGGFLGFLSRFLRSPFRDFSTLVPRSILGWLSVIFTILPAIGFASNSFTIWEDEIMMFFLSTFAVVTLVSSFRQSSHHDSIIGIAQASVFLVCTRLASLSRLCREEQMPYCRSTYYASSNSSTSAPWQLLIPIVVALLLPMAIKYYLQRTLSYEGPAIFWVGFAFRLGLLGSAIYWVLDAVDDNDWIEISKPILRTVKTVLARLIFGLSFAAGTINFLRAKPCISIELASTANGSPNNTGSRKSKKTVTVSGYANMHGSRYLLLLTTWIIAIVLLEKPMGGGAIGILTIQILSLLEIIDTNNLSQSAIAPTILALLGSFHFFKTGHQATFSSIQWEAAFIPLKSIRYPWSPLLIVLNTYGAQILTTIAVPLIVLWKQPPKKPGLLGDVAKAMATYLLYFAVVNLATTMWAGWLRRHLMLYRIFCPRFLTGAAVLVVVDMVGILVAVGGVRWNFESVAEVFGWA